MYPCGFVHSTRVTTPLKVLGCSMSYIAVEWCALTTGAANSAANTASRIPALIFIGSGLLISYRDIVFNSFGATALLALEQILIVLVVILADVLLDLPLRVKAHLARHRPGPRPYVGVVHRRGVVKLLIGNAMIALDDVVGRRVLVIADEGFVVEAGDVDDERVSVPMPDGIAHVGRVQVVRMSAAVGRDHAEDVIGLVENDDEPRLLNDLQRIGLHRGSRDAGRHAGDSLAEIVFLGNNLEAFGAGLHLDVVDRAQTEARDINTGKIGMSVGGARDGLIVRITACASNGCRSGLRTCYGDRDGFR